MPINNIRTLIQRVIDVRAVSEDGRLVLTDRCRDYTKRVSRMTHIHRADR